MDESDIKTMIGPNGAENLDGKVVLILEESDARIMGGALAVALEKRGRSNPVVYLRWLSKVLQQAAPFRSSAKGGTARLTNNQGSIYMVGEDKPAPDIPSAT